MTNLRREAIDRMCTIRLAGCKGAPCCLAHIRQSGISGMGKKAPDLLGAWACSSCHEKVDVKERGNLETQLDFYKAMAATINQLIKEGIVKW